MSVLLKPLPRAILSVVHDGVHVVDRAVVLAGPFDDIQRGVGRVPRVEAAAAPFADQLLRLDGLELVVHSGDGGLVNVAFHFDEFVELLLWSVQVVSAGFLQSSHVGSCLQLAAGRENGAVGARGDVRLCHSCYCPLGEVCRETKFSASTVCEMVYLLDLEDSGYREVGVDKYKFLLWVGATKDGVRRHRGTKMEINTAHRLGTYADNVQILETAKVLA